MAGPQPRTEIRTIDLSDQQMLLIEDRTGARLQVLAGGIWLTEPDAWDDRFARGGEQVWLHSSRGVLVQALGSTRLRLSWAAPRHGWTSLRTAWRKARGRLVESTLAGTLALVAGVGVLELTAGAFLEDSAAAAARVLAGSTAAGTEGRPAGG